MKLKKRAIKMNKEYKNQSLVENLEINSDGEDNIEINHSEVELNLKYENCERKLNFILNKTKLDINILVLSNESEMNSNIDLYSSDIDINCKTYTKKNAFKKLKINHLTSTTNSNINCLAIGDDEAKITFEVESVILEKCENSSAHQKTKVIALSEKVTADLKPILKIENHKVMGSHSATFSKITDREIYYMLTRGLNEKQAKKLIVKSNLLVNNERYYDKIEELIGWTEKIFRC